MGISEMFVALTGAAKAGRTLLEASNSLKNSELKSMIAALASQLAEAELEMAEAKTELARLELENKELKAMREKGRPTMKWGCYKFEGEEGLFCPKCWETKGKKHRTNRTDQGRFYQCTVCDTKFSTR